MNRPKNELRFICPICNKGFNDTRLKTCSRECGNKLRNLKNSQAHKNRSVEDQRKRSEKIWNTREKNGTTRRGIPNWNSGKRGIYTEEQIEKIRNAALKQCEEGRIVKTKIEIIMEIILETMQLKYKYSAIIGNRQFDFKLLDYNILIECDGDFWHANPKKYPNPSEFQKKRIEDDKIKNKIAEDNGYVILRFWEDDIHNNRGFILKIIKQTISLQRNQK